MSEIEFYKNNNVTITNSRFIVGSTTYAMNGVTSVKRGQTTPSKAGAVILGIIALIMVFAASSIVMKGIGILLILAAVAWFRAIKPEYIVFLNSSSGESQALSSSDKQYIDDVIGSLNEAIIHRG